MKNYKKNDKNLKYSSFCTISEQKMIQSTFKSKLAMNRVLSVHAKPLAEIISSWAIRIKFYAKQTKNVSR